MGQGDNNAKKPPIERLSQAYDSLEYISALLNEINTAASSNDDLTPSEQALLTQLKRRVQELAQECGVPEQDVATSQRLSTPTKSNTHARTRYPNRRKSSKSFDALLLMGIKYSVSEGRSVGQEQLYQLGRAYDPQTKRASLIAKLNRWKNSNEYIVWEKPEMITLTGFGQKEVRDLEHIARTNGDLGMLRTTITEVLGVTPSS